MSIDIRERPEFVSIEKLSTGSPIESFSCSIDEYNTFLREEALPFQSFLITNTYLLIERESHEIVAYISLIADSLKLSSSEKDSSKFPFQTIPAMKIAKLAVDRQFKGKYNHVGTFMIDIAESIAVESNNKGMACRFITVDADVEHDENVCDFYQKNGFINNDHKEYKKRSKTISMRRDLYKPIPS